MLTLSLLISIYILNVNCYFVLKILDLEFISICLTGLEFRCFDFQLELTNVLMSLSDMFFSFYKMISYLVKLKVQSVDLFHEEYYLEGLLTIFFYYLVQTFYIFIFSLFLYYFLYRNLNSLLNYSLYRNLKSLFNYFLNWNFNSLLNYSLYWNLNPFLNYSFNGYLNIYNYLFFNYLLNNLRL